MCPWLGDDEGMLADKRAALHLMDLESMVNRVSSCMMLSIMACRNDLKVPLVHQAAHVRELRKAAGVAHTALEPLRGMMAALVLRVSTAMVANWFDCVAAFGDSMMKMVLSTQSRDLLVMAQKIDSARPGWGNFISDKSLQDDLTRSHLAENTAIASLPAQIRQFGSNIKEFKEIGETFGITNLQENLATRDAARVSYKSFNFARRTVAVAAGAKALFDSEDRCAHSARMALVSFKSALPGGLILRLEAAALDAEGDEGEDLAAASALPAASGDKRSLEHASCSSASAAAKSKRPLSG